MRSGPLAGSFAVLAACLALGAFGIGVDERLDPLSLEVAGTAAAEGQKLEDDHFGDSTPFAILLQGPPAAIDRQGPGLVRALRADPRATVISAWDRGAVEGLRPAPDRTVVLVDYDVTLEKAMRDTVPELEALIERRISAPVTATKSGFADVASALQEEALRTSERAELLAAPLLILVLLFVFRSVVAAAIPLLFGALTVVAGRGVLSLLSDVMTIDALSLVVCTMLGLALGVDYSLLIVSRFREELAVGDGAMAAAMRARGSAGRTAVFAGSTFLIAILLTAFLQPGTLLLSIATAAAVVTAISVTIAVAALPGLLAVLGERVNALPLPGSRPARQGTGIAAAAAAALRRPNLAAIVIAVPLLLLALPALAFRTGAPGIDQLPESNEARAGAERIDAAIGPGWEAPFVLIAATESGPITTRADLDLLARWQERIAARPGVRAVIGPAPLKERVEPLDRLGQRLASGETGEQLSRLGPGLGRSADAIGQLRDGLARAAAGSGLLDEGAARAREGAGQLADGLERAAGGAEEANDAVARLEDGTHKLGKAQRQVAVGTLSLDLGLRSLVPQVRGGSLHRAKSLAAALERAAEADPTLADEAHQARTLVDSISETETEAVRLRGIAGQVDHGVNRIVDGTKRLDEGVAKLGRGAEALGLGLGALSEGAARLALGLGELEGGTGALAENLAAGYERSRPLETGLRQAGVRVSAEVAPLERGLDSVRRDSPGLFDSGYFVLSALDGAPPGKRRLAAEAVDIDSGGQAARMIVIPRFGFNTEGSAAVGAALGADAERIADESGLRTGLTGGAATLNDYSAVTKARIPIVIAAVILVTFLVLLVVLRAPLLAALAVVLNLASVGAAVGVMTLVTRIPEGYPLGGHPYVDTVGAAGIFGITFGLSIDYAVFLIARMRERYERDGDHAAAIAFGLERTAGVITGAAAIMAAVFVAFAAAPIATISQMGVGLTVAILLDATVIRLILFPALMLRLGERVWGTPGWLDRALPRIELHGPSAGAEVRREAA